MRLYLLAFFVFYAPLFPQTPNRITTEQRPAAVARQAELYEQNDPRTAQGLWFDGYTVGVIGWQGQAVPRGAQVSLKGRNFVGRSVLLVLRYSWHSELGDWFYTLPRVKADGFLPNFPVESVGFFLPPFVTGPVEAFCYVDDRKTNTVIFNVQ